MPPRNTDLPRLHAYGVVQLLDEGLELERAGTAYPVADPRHRRDAHGKEAAYNADYSLIDGSLFDCA